MVRNYVRNAVLVNVALICVPGHGAEPIDLIARLKKLDGKNMIQAAVHVEDRTSRKDDKDIKPLKKGDFVITAEPNALTVAVTGRILDSKIFREFSLLRAGGLGNCARHLVKELHGLKLIENRGGSYQGVARRRWRLKSEEKQKNFGINSTTTQNVELWIDSGGYPLAAVFRTKSKDRMLLFKFSAEAARNQRYRRVGNRLVLVFDKNETDVDSKVGKEERTVITTVKTKDD